MKSPSAHRSSVSLAAAIALSLVTALATASSPRAESSDARPAEIAEPAQPTQSPCGNPGAPPCPLQSWMRANVAQPLAGNNMNALADGLDRAARLAPDMSWTSWRTIAAQGADAARKGNIAGARAACKSCHETWREAYKAKFRNRPIPR